MFTFVLALVFASGAAAGATVPETVDAAAFPNYRVLAPGVAAAGQPSVEGLRALEGLGFRTVINLRTEKEPGVAEEKRIVEEAGLRYVHVPVSVSSFSAADVDRVAKVLDDPTSGPVLLHCASANRVGAVWTVLQVRKGKSHPEAEAEGRTIGLGGAMLDAVRRVVETETAN